MGEIIEAGSITLDKEPSRIVDAGSIELDKTSPEQGESIRSWKGPTLTEKFFRLFENPEKEQAKSVQALVDSQALGISPSQAYRYRDQIDEGVKINPQAAAKRSTLSQRVKQSFDIGVKQNQIGELGYQYIVTGDPKYLDSINKIGMPGEGDIYIPEGKLEGAFRAAAKMFPMMADTAAESTGAGLTTGMAVAGAVALLGQAGPQVALPEEIVTVPAAFGVGFTAGAGAKAFEASMRKEAGLALSEIIKLKDADGKPIDPNIARAASFGIGVINGAIEVAQLKMLIKTIPGLNKVISKALIETVADKTVKDKLVSLASAYAGTVTKETGQEIAQESSNIVFEELAKKINNNVKGTKIDPATVDDIVKRLHSTALESAQAFSVFAAPGTIVTAGKAVMPAGQSKVKQGGAQATQAAGLAGIGSFESGGKYTAEHPTSKAYGKYQIMPSNWGPWAKEAGLPADAPKTPENQEIVANFKYNQYLERFGGNDQLAATAWFAGPAAAQRLMNGDTTVLSKSDANGTTVEQYIMRTTGREFGAEGMAQTAANIDDVITRAIETDDDIDQIANDFFAGMVTEEEQMTEQGLDVSLEGIPDTALAEQQGAFVETIKTTLNEKGSIDLTPIVDLGRTVYQQGAQTFEKFQARVKELVGDAWEKVKDLVRQAWDVISNERGKITVKGPKQETLESYARKKKINFNIPGYSNKEAIKNGLFGFVKNDAISLDKFAEEAQGMGLLGETPEEYSGAGDYLYEELKKIIINRAKNKTTFLLSEKERDIIELREELKRDGYNEREIEEIINQAEGDSEKDFSSQDVDEQARIARNVLEEEEFVSEDELEDASEQTTGETGLEPETADRGEVRDRVASAYNQAETQATAELTTLLAKAEKALASAQKKNKTTAIKKAQEKVQSVKARIREATGQTKGPKVITEMDALKAAMKKAEQASRAAFKAGNKAALREAVKNIKTIKQQIADFVGQRKSDEKTVTEYDALKASFVKAAQAARVAYREGNKEGVEKAKTEMREALSKAREKRSQEAQRKKDIKAIKKLSQMKGNIAVDYQKKIRDLMEGFDFKNITPKKWEQLKGLQDFIEKEGIPLGINPKRLSELKRLTDIPLKALDNEQIAMLRKQLEELTALGKLKASLKYKYNERKRAELERKILSTTRNLDPSVQFEKGELRRRDKMKVAATTMYLNTMHTPRVADLADGYNDYKGEQARLIKKSGEAETRAVVNASNRQQAWLDYLKENNITLPVEGSESDIRMNIVIRLREGATKQAEMLMDHYGIKDIPELTADEEKIIEYIRQDMERNKAKLGATWEEINGEIFPEQRVYYLPLKYQGEEELLPETQTEGRGRTTHTFDGFSHARRPNVKKLPKVGIAQLFQDATMEQEWFTGLQPIVEDIKSVVLTPAYKEQAGSVLYDWWKTQLDIMSRRGWTASAQMTALSSALATIRHNITTATLAFKATTIIMQPMAVFDAMAYVNSSLGPVAAAKIAGAVTKSFLSPKWSRGIIEGSEALKQRAGGELAIQEELARLDDSKMDKIKKAGFDLIQKTDIKTAAGVQESVRKTLIAEGMDEEEALREAEFIMHLSQGSTSVTYRPHILAQGEGYRTWFTFQNFVLNRWGIMIHDIVMGKIVNGDGVRDRLLGTVALGILVAGGMAEDEARRKIRQIYSTPKEDKRSTFEQIVVNVLGAIPFFGSFVTAISQKFDAQPPTISHVQKSLEGAFQTVKGKDTKSKVKGGLKLSEAMLTIFLGIPGTGQIFDLIEAGVNKKGSDDRRNR